MYPVNSLRCGKAGPGDPCKNPLIAPPITVKLIQCHGAKARKSCNEGLMSTKAIFRIAALLIAATAATLASAQDRNLRIDNDTGVTLYRFYSTNSGSTTWGSDVMGSSTLPSGSAMNLNFDNSFGYCEFDFLAVFEDGTEMQHANVNVCEIGDYHYSE
ncbi:MAG: hypothetical protein INF92_06115 [Rhodobacter sp.]|nr:hypothetical protein [Rhodobacter sp.]